jgi:Antitoxin of toxin-antitoxin, RelE / RelB, TA system
MAEGTTLLDEISVTAARQMRQYYDNVVHGKRPLLMTRYHEPGAVVMPREDLALMLRRYRFTLDVLPEDDGSFTLWVPEVGIGESGKTLHEARRALLDAVRAYVRQYWNRYEVWRHIHDKSAQWPYILRLSLAQNDQELLGMLLESVPQPPTAQEPVDT